MWTWANKVALLSTLAASWYMAGLIAFVHRVHYPLFERVDAPGFPAYHAGHTRLTTGVVLVPMLVELAGAAWLAARRPPGIAPWAAWAGLALAGFTWGVTALAAVPAHRSLAPGFDPAALQRLMAADRARLAAWFAHAGIAASMAWGAIR